MLVCYLNVLPVLSETGVPVLLQLPRPVLLVTSAPWDKVLLLPVLLSILWEILSTLVVNAPRDTTAPKPLKLLSLARLEPTEINLLEQLSTRSVKIVLEDTIAM